VWGGRGWNQLRTGKTLQWCSEKE